MSCPSGKFIAVANNAITGCTSCAANTASCKTNANTGALSCNTGYTITVANNAVT